MVSLGAILVFTTGLSTSKDILLLLAFSLSACSFWKFAHIAAVGNPEKYSRKKRTFNADFAIGILAFSFPFSVVVILGVLFSGSVFISFTNLLLLGTGLSFPGMAYILYNYLSKMAANSKKSTKTAYNLPVNEGF